MSDQAEAAYKAGNFTEAIALREEVIQQKRCDKELAAKNQYLAGYIYHKKLNDMDKAKAAFNNVIAIHPKSEYATKAQNKLTLEEGRTKAISAVQATPDDYGLIDLNDMENTVASERENAFKKGSSEGKAQGIEEGHASGIVTVRTTPYEYGLYTKADIKVHESKARELALEEGQLKGKRQGIKIVKTNPAVYGLTPFLPELPISQKGDKSRSSTNNQWHYQPEWGWLWTNEEIFPYVYLAGTGGKTPGWYYLPEVSGKSRSFYSYAKEEWATFDNK
jgi:tetratricopeptide (TPR) repeat protein